MSLVIWLMIMFKDCWVECCVTAWRAGRIRMWLGDWVVGWLDGWMVGWLDGWMVGWLDGRTLICVYERMGN